MEPAERLRRREAARRRTRRQRRVAAAGAAAIAALGALLALVLRGGGAERAPAGEPPGGTAPSELPRGGLELLPRHRIVAFYGSPGDPELGVLGSAPPARVARRLARQARAYRAGGRPLLPAFELIAVVATASPGADGGYRQRLDQRQIARYLRAARRARALLVLDVQPGRADPMEEVRALERFLREPDVGLALDPEWTMQPGQVPGAQIGSMDATEVNAVSGYLARIVRRERLPEKLLLVHRFTEDMVTRDELLERPRGVELVVNIDGFGDRPNKIAKYRQLADGRGPYGFKLFYQEDTDLMSPRQVLRLRPRPAVVVYE